MEIKKRFNHLKKFIGIRKKPVIGCSGEDGECFDIDDDDDETAEKTEEAEGTKGKEIVVSLKKLEAKIKSDTDIKGKKVKIENQEYTILNIIEKLKNDREKAKKILINWINTYYKSIENNCEELVLIFSLISFYFRNDSSKTITEVKFGEKNSKLLQKTKAWINKNMKGDGNESKTNMSQLFEKAKNITDEQWGKMANLITAISAGKVERMARKAKKKVKQVAHNVKKRTIGSDSMSPETLEKFHSFWIEFNEKEIKQFVDEGKFNDKSSLIKYLSEALYFGEFKNKFGEITNLEDLKKIKFPKNFEKEWETFVESIEEGFNKATASAPKPAVANTNVADHGSNPTSVSKEEEAAEQKAGEALRKCYTAKDGKYLTDINTIIVNIDQKIESEKELKDALNPVKEKLNKIKEETAKNGDNREVLNKLINELTNIPKINRQDLVGLKCALEEIPEIKEKLPNVEGKRQVILNYQDILSSDGTGDAWKAAIAGNRNQTGSSNSQQQTAAFTAATSNGQQGPSGAGDSSPNEKQKRPALKKVKAIEVEENTTPQTRTVEVKKAENLKPEEATVEGNPQGAKPQQHSASQYISKQVEEALANENITFDDARRVLDDIKTNEATSHMKTVLAKIPEPIKGNTFPENLELLGVNEDDYKNIKKIWLKAQELAPKESVTGTTPTPQILKPNFPISEAVPQATAVEGTQGAEPQQHGAGDPSLKKAPSQTAQTPKAARMVGRARYSQIGRKGRTQK